MKEQENKSYKSSLSKIYGLLKEITNNFTVSEITIKDLLGSGFKKEDIVLLVSMMERDKNIKKVFESDTIVIYKEKWEKIQKMIQAFKGLEKVAAGDDIDPDKDKNRNITGHGSIFELKMGIPSVMGKIICYVNRRVQKTA